MSGNFPCYASRRKRLAVVWQSALCAAFIALDGYPALARGDVESVILIVLGISTTYLMLANLTSSPPDVDRSMVLVVCLIVSTAGGSRALDYAAASPTFARLGLLAALLFNAVVFGWALTATIDRRRRAKEAEAVEAADRRRREREIAAGSWRAYPDSAFESRFDAQHGPEHRYGGRHDGA